MKNRNIFVPLACAALVVFGGVQLYAAITVSSTNVPLAIPDAGNINSTLMVVPDGSITDANLDVNITHTWNDDIELTLTSPTIAAQALWNDCGGSSDNTIVTIDQDAAALNTCPGAGPISGVFQPTNGTAAAPVAATGTMDAFNGSMSAGTWTLNVADDSSICTGTLNSWSITLDGAPPLPVELMNFEIG